MSNIINYKTGRTVNLQDYVNDGFGDVYERSLIETSVLPCIYSGFEVTAGSGLTVVVSPGYARGLGIPFTINGATASPLPTIVNDITTVSTINIPANSVGYIVLNVNIWDSETGTTGYTSNGNLYKVSATTNANIPSGSNVGAMFVTSLQNGTNTSWPFTQIILAYVTSTTNSVNIVSRYSPPINGVSSTARSFSWQDYVDIYNNGNISTVAPPQGVINIPNFINNLGTNNQVLMPTLAWQYGVFNTSNNGQVSSTSGVVSLNTPFPVKVIFAIVDGFAIGKDSQNNNYTMPVSSLLNTSNVNSTFLVGTSPPIPIASIQFIGNYLALGY